MPKFPKLILCLWMSLALTACDFSDDSGEQHTGAAAVAAEKDFPVQKTEAQWKELLSPKAFAVLRKHDTERAFSGRYDKHKEDGVYYCAACGHRLFDSRHKFDSGTGWPSYYKPIESGRVGEKDDYSLFGMKRVEVHCKRCGGHLGHVFDDGPKPTGLRYCINSASLNFKERSASPPPLLK